LRDEIGEAKGVQDKLKPKFGRKNSWVSQWFGKATANRIALFLQFYI